MQARDETYNQFIGRQREIRVRLTNVMKCFNMSVTGTSKAIGLNWVVFKRFLVQEESLEFKELSKIESWVEEKEDLIHND